MKYLHNLGYYCVSFVDSSINFMASIIGAYPKVDLATSFLIYLELKRVDKEIGGRLSSREANRQKADAQMGEAKDILYGKDEQAG